MVDRYKVVVGEVTATAHAAAHPDGQYVSWHEYEALRAEVEAHKRSRQIDANEARSREMELRAEVESLSLALKAANDGGLRDRAEVERLRAQAIECGTHHPDYIIGTHWLAAAYSRICAGEDEKAVMADYGYAYISLPDRPLTVWEVIRAVELARERITLRVRDAGPTPAALWDRECVRCGHKWNESVLGTTACPKCERAPVPQPEQRRR